MDLYIITGLLIFNSYVRGNNPQNDSSLGYEDNWELNQPPARREVSNIWAQSQDLLDGDFPSNYYIYYPHDVRYLQTDYLDYPISEGEHSDRKNSSLSSSISVQEPGSSHEPQYYQKNYYYNYYPMANRGSLAPTKWKNDERSHGEDPSKRRRVPNSKKFHNQNSCKQYLEFLKYAFEKLGEHPDYSYDYAEEEQWRDKLAQGNQHVFTTQMAGPTLYVDNSGNIAQFNSKENSIKSYDIYSTVPNAPHNRSLGFKSSTPLKSQTSSSAHPSHQHPSSRSHSLSKTQSRTPGKNNFKHHKPTTENSQPTTESSVKMVSSSPSSRTNYTHETVTPVNIANRRSEEMEQHSNKKVEKDDKHNYPHSSTTTTAPATYWPSSEDYYNTVGNFSEQTTEYTPVTSYVVNNGSDRIGASYNLLSPSTSQTPTRIPIPYSTEIAEHFNSDDTTTKKDTDCNDKMLPCPDTVNITYPLNGYCNRYVSCEAGRAIRRTCPEGLHFNIITKSCDLPHNSFCTYACPKPNGYFGIPGDCGGYFFCKNSMPEYRMCPPHMHWNLEKRSCSFVEFSSCPMRCTSANEVKHYEGDCKAYVICLAGVSYYYKCPPGTKFNKTSLTCVPDSSFKCEDDPRLLTKTVNPNAVCRDVELKVGNKTWCSFFQANQQRTYIP